MCSLFILVFLNYFYFVLFLTGEYLHYTVLVSAIQQCESAISVHVSPPSGTSLPPPPSHPSRSLNTRLSTSSGPGPPCLVHIKAIGIKNSFHICLSEWDDIFFHGFIKVNVIHAVVHAMFQVFLHFSKNI